MLIIFILLVLTPSALIELWPFANLSFALGLSHMLTSGLGLRSRYIPGPTSAIPTGWPDLVGTLAASAGISPPFTYEW